MFKFHQIFARLQLDTQTVIAYELGYISKEEQMKVEEDIAEIRRMTYALISRLPR